jgi:hypothetical protein
VLRAALATGAAVAVLVLVFATHLTRPNAGFLGRLAKHLHVTTTCDRAAVV